MDNDRRPLPDSRHNANQAQVTEMQRYPRAVEKHSDCGRPGQQPTPRAINATPAMRATGTATRHGGDSRRCCFETCGSEYSYDAGTSPDFPPIAAVHELDGEAVHPHRHALPLFIVVLWIDVIDLPWRHVSAGGWGATSERRRRSPVR
jgi:hypothetical protein